MNRFRYGAGPLDGPLEEDERCPGCGQPSFGLCPYCALTQSMTDIDEGR